MINKKKIIVIKIGSSVIFTRRNKLDEFRISHLAYQIVELRKYRISPILVVSGAVALGMNTFISGRLHLLPERFIRQAAASIGQVYLISKLNGLLGQRKLTIAQILLTKENLQAGVKREQIKQLLNFYLENNILPVLNENDAVELNSFGGNDYLAGEIALITGANNLVILSSWEGSKYGVGGGVAKQKVIKDLANHNVRTCIINGKEKDAIIRSIL